MSSGFIAAGAGGGDTEIAGRHKDLRGAYRGGSGRSDGGRQAAGGKGRTDLSSDSYGYRPGRSALDAVAICRRRCWDSDWVIDLDIRKFFDTVPWDLVLKAVAANTDQPWVLLYVDRWLRAPVQQADGTLIERDCGTPQGSAVSPVLQDLDMESVCGR